jgi:hypothetical protein
MDIAFLPDGQLLGDATSLATIAAYSIGLVRTPALSMIPLMIEATIHSSSGDAGY